MESYKIAILIPAYNEEKTIEKVISKVLPLYGDVIVVDDGSNDNTFNIAKNSKAIVLKNKKKSRL